MTRAEHLAAYRAALADHDWNFEFSEARQVVERGRESLKALEEARRLIDQDYLIWNEIAPAEYRRTPPATAAREGS